MKRKAQIPLKFLMGLVIFIALMLIPIQIGKQYLRLSSQAKESFNELTELIEEVNKKDIGYIDSIPLRMDEDTAIVFFDEESNLASIEFKATERNIPRFAIKKPDDCLGKQNCLCLCQSVDKAVESLIDIKGAEWTEDILKSCNRRVCVDTKALFYECSWDDYTKCTGGFILEIGIAKKSEPSPRTRAIYVEKGKDVIGVCENPPCLPSFGATGTW